MHRVWWDLRYQPLAEGGGRGGGAAVPRRTYPPVNAPWAPPGNYTVRLSANGKSYTQPLTLRLDPRVKTPAAGLTTLSSLTREMYEGAKAARATAEQARELSTKVQEADPDTTAFRAHLAALAPPPPAAGRGRGGVAAPPPPAAEAGRGGGRGAGRGGAPSTGPAAFDTVSATMLTAAMALQAADVTPTAREIAAVTEARRQSAALMAQWTKLTTVDLPALNAKRKAAGQAAIDWQPRQKTLR